MNASDLAGGGLTVTEPYSLNFALWVSRQAWFQTDPALAMVWQIWWDRLVLVRRMDPTQKFRPELYWADPQWAPPPFPNHLISTHWEQQWDAFIRDWQGGAKQRLHQEVPSDAVAAAVRRTPWSRLADRLTADCIWDPTMRIPDFLSDATYCLLRVPRGPDDPPLHTALETWLQPSG